MNRPPCVLQFASNDFISYDIFIQLLVPEFGPRFRPLRFWTTQVLMPETTVNENDLFILGKNDIGVTG